MKPAILFVILCLPLVSYSQITFEQLTTPVDFSIAEVRKSPVGEYIVQAINDRGSIYNSLNGVDWTKTFLPILQDLDVIQFFSNGTPVLKAERGEHLIRRNGIWYTMNATGGNYAVEASFIKDDSLFVYQDQTFAFSLDKGKNFTTVFTSNDGITDHSVHLWKFAEHFVLYHTAGAAAYLSVFTQAGERVLYEYLGVSSPTFIFNSCGEVLIHDNYKYYVIKEQGLTFSTGPMSSIFPGFSIYTNLLSQGGRYYIKDEGKIYKSTGCNFSFELLADQTLINSHEKIWLDDLGDIFLYNSNSDHFYKQASGTNVWEEHAVDIPFAFVDQVSESGRQHQITMTPNALFNKKSTDEYWGELEPIPGFRNILQYSPNGNLYINRPNDILFSSDNGYSFSSVPLPHTGSLFDEYGIEVLDDNVIFFRGTVMGDSYYTLNNGQSWVTIGLIFAVEFPQVKLVDNNILIASLDSRFTITKIDLSTNEKTVEEIGNFFNNEYYGTVILDDGTIYFHGEQALTPNPEGLYRYRFGEQLEFLGQFQELAFLTLTSSGSDLYVFDQEKYFSFNGSIFTEYTYDGFSLSGSKKFMISENEYLYAIVNDHQIFRSVKPLTFTQNITGSIYHHSYPDCVLDTLDPGLSYWQVKVENDEYIRIKLTDSHGKFNFAVPDGQYVLSSQPNNTNWSLCDSGFNITINENQPIIHQDFIVNALKDCAELEIDFSTSMLRRCFNNFYSVRVRNTGPQASAGSILTLQLDPFFEFTDATIPYIQVNDHLIEFDLGILAVNEEIYFKIYFDVSCDADFGIEHCLTGYLKDDNECGGDRSTYTECQENVGAYDPNDKRVFNEDGREADHVDKGEYIYYHIRFQNTGTDTAFNVRVVDPLSPILDLNTLEMLSASHPYEFVIIDGPNLEVSFKNILLPDSTKNEPASHGFFKFRIKPLAAYDYGTIIPNEAGIYFDFNDPVLTNETTLVIMQSVGIKEATELIEFKVYPNPTNNKLTLTISEDDLHRIDSYEIIDQFGRMIAQSPFTMSGNIDVSKLTNGLYNLILREDGAIAGAKSFIKN